MPKLNWIFFSKGHTKIYIPGTYYFQEWMELRWGFIYLMISLGPVVLIHFLCLNDSWDNCNFQFRTICTSDGSSYVQSSMFHLWSQKYGIQVRLPLDEHVWVRSMFVHLKPKIGCLSSITNRWTCSNQVRSMFDKMVFYPSLICNCKNYSMCLIRYLLTVFQI